MMENGTDNSKTGVEIAVIGMMARFPGAGNIEEFWNHLTKGTETVAFFSEEEIREEGGDPRSLANPAYVKAYGWLEDIESYDYSFFGYTPLEAELMDPQLCLLHECAFQVLEHAGYDAFACDALIGLYAGGSHNFDWQARVELSGKNAILGRFASMQVSDKDFLATRIAHRLSLKGPAVTLDTACSTSLVAIHMACQGLLAGDCDMALAGGVSIPTLSKRGYLYQEGMLFSPDGHCHAFDQQARGCNFGNGVGLVVLKRLEEAEADGDTIHAVIKGSSINNDGGRKSGYTAPSIEGQAEVIRSALEMAEVESESIGYVETHGTGTPLGDPVEMEGLRTAFNTEKRHFCRIGSVKTNIGHLEISAGIAGFIKTVLVLKHGLIPPTLFFQTPNPKIDFENSPFVVNTVLTRWARGENPRRAGVSSFGIGGTNAHVVLEESPRFIVEQEPLPGFVPGGSSEVAGIDRGEGSEASTGIIGSTGSIGSMRPYHLLLLSAKSASVLEQMSSNLSGYFNRHPGTSLADAAYTLQVGRALHPHRRMAVCGDAAEAARLLVQPGSAPVKTFYSREDNRPVVFMFPGLGAQYVDMGRGLYRQEPLFRREMDRCFEIAGPLLGYDFKAVLYPGEEDNGSDISSNTGSSGMDGLTAPEVAQVGIFMVEYCLVRLLMSWGVKPRAMIGYSFGEYAAACIAGIFTLAEGLKMVVARGKLLQGLEEGAMLSVPLEREVLAAYLSPYSSRFPQISLAIDNGPSGIVSGPKAEVAAFEEAMKQKRLMCMRLPLLRALHSGMMTPILQEFGEVLQEIRFKAPQIPMISNVSGDWLPAGEEVGPGYWTTHLQSTVEFARGMKVLLEEPGHIWLEVGPGRDLSALAQRHLEEKGKGQDQVIHLMRTSKRDADDSYLLLNRLGLLWLWGQPVDWQEYYRAEQRRRIPLPVYPFESQRCWIDREDLDLNEKMSRLSQLAAGSGGSPLGRGRDLADWFYLPSWKRSVIPWETAEALPADACWVIFSDEGGWGSLWKEHLEREIRPPRGVITVRAAERFERVSARQFIINPRQEADYDNLFKELRRQRMTPARVLHLWCITTGRGKGQPSAPGPDNRSAEQSGVDRILDLGFYSLLYIARALGEDGFKEESELAVITDYMQEVSGGDGLYPEKAALLGAIRVIPLEYPNIKCRSIDVILPFTPPGERDSAEQGLVRQLLTELQLKPAEPVVAYRGRYRWLQMFEPFRCEEALKERSPLKSAGVYLVTGGLGGIGLALAGYLARQVRARLVLVSRTALPPRQQWESLLADPAQEQHLAEKIKKIRELEQSGAEVLVLRADVADPGEMKQALSRAEAEFGPLDGILHCAGLADGEMIRFRTRESTQRILRAKVAGTLVLDFLLTGLKKKPSFVILCSSISAMVPALGQAGYCAANAFLDAYAHSRKPVSLDPRSGPLRILSINWDRWRGTGIATILEERHKQLTGEEMPGGMSVEENLEAFDRILFRLPAQVVVTNRNLEALIRRSRERKVSSLLEGVGGINVPKNRGQRPNLDVPYLAPVTGTQRVLVNLWTGFFGFDRVGIQDDFFDLGGDSLKALVLLPKIHKELEVEIPVTDFFDRPTIEELAGYIDGAAKSTYSPITVVEKRQYYTLSSGQKRLYILQQMQKSSNAYNESQVASQPGNPDRSALAANFRRLIARHESLRTSFHLIDGVPVQRVHDEVDFEVEYFEAEDGETLTSESVMAKFFRPFSLDKAPLLRVGLVAESPQRSILLVDMHHIITDGTSNQLLLQEFARLQAGKELPPLRIQYRDYAEWFNREPQLSLRRKQESYWLKELSGELSLLDLPTDYERPLEQSFAGKTLGFSIGPEESRALRDLLPSVEATLYMKLLAIFYLFLYKLSGQEDIIIGSPTAGRRHVDLESLIGMFVNTLAFRNSPRPAMTFDRFLMAVKETSLRGFQNQEYAFEDLIDRLNVRRDLSRNPVFDVFFIFQTQDQRKGEGRSSAEPVGYRYSLSKFDITLYVSENGDRLGFRFEYCVKLFRDESIERFMGYMKRIIAEVIANPHQQLGEIEILSAEQRHRLLEEFNDTAGVFPGPRHLHRLFSEQAALTPEGVALAGPSIPAGNSSLPEAGVPGKDPVHLSYQELQHQVNHLAQLLLERGVSPDTVVGIMVERSLEMITGLLAILSAGGAYLPLDPEYPAERIHFMLKDSNTALLVTTPGQAAPGGKGNAAEWEGEKIFISAFPGGYPASCPLPASQRGENLAYVLYTSGSTGTPKGVAITHGNTVNFIAGMKAVMDFLPGKSILALTTLCFDIFFLETLLPVTCGLKVVIAGESQQKNPSLLQILLLKMKPDIIQMTPSRLKLLLEFAGGSECLSGIRELVVGGETFPPSLFEQLPAVFPGKIYNVYGPTETTIWSTVKNLSQAAPADLTIGSPILNTQIYIVSGYNLLQPLGVAGELLIGGEGVAAGYLNNPELTSEQFQYNPKLLRGVQGGGFLEKSPPGRRRQRYYHTGDLARWLVNGEIQFLGRWDRQVKIRGYRIELQEIESQLLLHEQLSEVKVTAGVNKMGEQYLCAYFVPRPADPGNPGSAPCRVEVSQLRKTLAAVLPDYMLPSYFVPLERIPLTPNGKVNVKALPSPEGKAVDAITYVAPASSREKILAAIWKEVLSLEKVGLHDNFFNLGGNSLNVLRLNQKLLKAFGREIPLTEMFRNLTIHFLDRYLMEDEGENREQKWAEEVKQADDTFEKSKKTFKNTINRFRVTGIKK